MNANMASFAQRAPFFNSTNTNGVNRSSWADPRDPPAHSNDRPFLHLKDIIATAQPTFDPSVQLNEYLNQVERCIASAKTSLNFGKADVAFREYITASEIAVNLIPRHKDYGFFEYNDQRWFQRYKANRQNLNALQTEMEGVRKIIEDNNQRHGTQQQSTVSQNAVSVPGVEQSFSRPASQTSVHSGSEDLPQQLKVDRARPTKLSKPDHLRGPSATSNDLLQRFAELRTVPETRPALSMPDAKDYQSNENGENVVSRPLGPREMPVSQSAPSLPPKLPIATAAMPKPPDPTYSPVNISSGMTSARSAHDTHRPPTEKKQSYYGQPITPAPSSQLRRAKEEIQPYRPKTPNGVHHAIIPKSNSSDIPHAEMINAEMLSRYLKKYNVLLVDIRDRTFFDEGHIFATSILCIEPLSLKEGTSAEGLGERLVLSPDNEQALFSSRNEFDVVVYYDQNTSDCSYLRGHPTMSRTPHLRAFFDTLYEFNEYKPLKDGRPPALLQGGLDAWIDLMGPHSLATSKTAAIIGTTRQRLASSQGKLVGRQRMASTNSRFEIRDRRMQNQRFLNEKEQEAWLQQAQQEQVTIDDGIQLSEGEFVQVEEEEEPPKSPYIPDYETFLRRFPNIEQQSMTLPQRRPVVPPKRPEPPPLPVIPSRPPPAVPRPSYSGQAEINQTQAPLARVTSSTRQPLYASSLALRRQKLPRTGLANFGNTCYMNATLQCLSGTIPLVEFFMDESIYRPNIQKANWKGSKGIMPEHFANTVRALWKGDAVAIKPTSFRQFCGAVNSTWKTDAQQDSKEFFDWLVDLLHEDFNIAYNRNPLKPLTQEQEFLREKYNITEAGPIEWDRFQHRERSFISSLFAGQHASRLRCLSCGNTSTTYEVFTSLSIEIPRSGRGDIYSCLQSYTQEEHLPPEEQIWQCPYCKRKGAYTKQILLTRLPQFLVIHFKRFSASLTERARKIHTPVNFPLHGLDMTPFVVSRPANAPAVNGADQLEKSPATTPPFSYDAYGVLKHLGSTLNSGHYIGLVKDHGRGCWRKFDDEHNYDFDPTRLNERDKLQNGDAYIVFFQRSNPR